MLSRDEERIVEQVLLEFARGGPARATESASILSRLPPGPEALEHLVTLARRRGLPWVETVAVPQAAPPLDQLLASAEPYPRKVDALLAAVRAPTPALAELIRARLAVETDAFVLATLASCLGRCGAASDDAHLRPLIAHADTRVAANALESLRRLAVRVPAAELEPALASSDTRVRMNALALLALTDAARALDLIAGQSLLPDPGSRAGLGFVLGDLAGEVRAVELLLEMIAREQQMLVLKQLVKSLRRHVTRENAGSLLERLAPVEAAAQGAKLSLVSALTHDLKSETPRPEPVEEEDVLTFADVWGKPEPAPEREPSRKVPALVVPAAEPPRAGLGWLAAAGGAVGVLALVAWMQPAPAANAVPRSVQIKQAQAAHPHGAAAVTRPAPAAASGPAREARRADGAGGDAREGTSPTPRHFGTVGAPVDVSGTVVGKRKGGAIITSTGRYFMIVAGPVPEDLRAGEPFRLIGTLVGRSIDGLFYVEAKK